MTGLRTERLPGLGHAAVPLAAVAALTDRLASCGAAATPIDVHVEAPADLCLTWPELDARDLAAAARDLGQGLGRALERAVAELHAAGVVHGSISVDTVAVDARGEVRLFDAGLASIVDASVSTPADDWRALARLNRQLEAESAVGRRRKRMSDARRRAHRVLALATFGPVILLVLFTLARGHHTGSRAGTSPSAARWAAQRSTPALAPCTAGSLPAEPGGQLLSADTAGNGCAEPVEWISSRAEVLTVTADGSHVLAFAIGSPGDVLVVGRWHCGPDLPAVYRPSTGAVYLFGSWPFASASGPSTITSAVAIDTAVTDGTPHAIPGHGRCESVVVTARSR